MKSSMINMLPCILLSLLPACIMFSGTALVLEIADQTRWSAISDDAALPSLIGFIHPAAALSLTLGYLIAIVLPIWTILQARPGRVRTEKGLSH